MRLLSRSDVEKLITMKETLGLMKDVFSEVAKNAAILPERTVIELSNKTDAVLFMPAYIPRTSAIGIKIVSIFPNNVLKGIPTTTAQILLNNPDTGEVLCIMDGGIVTALRTGAVSGVATDILSRRDAENLGVFGAGVQAKTQIEAILEVRKINCVKICDINSASAQKLAREMDEINAYTCRFQAVESPDAVVTNSDIVVTATTSKTPVFDGNLLRPGTHINSIGSFKPSSREVDDTTIRRSRIFVDSTLHALKEAGDLIIPIKKGILSKRNIQANLGELIAGEKTGRKDVEEITFFKSVGMAVEDIAVAQMIYRKAEENNLGILF